MLSSTPPDSDESRDGRDRGRRDSIAMSSRDQLRFMQLWGERREEMRTRQLPQSPESLLPLPQSMTFHTIMSRRPSTPDILVVAQPSQAGLTYVPRSAWEGLPETATQPLSVLEDQPADDDVLEDQPADDDGLEDQPADDDGLEAPMMAQLARSDQLSEESIASVQSFCGASGSPDNLEGGCDNTGAPKSDQDEQRILREPAEVAAMLRNITCGRRRNYADNAFALRLEKDVWAELRAELERQNRFDARLEKAPSEDAPSPSSSAAAPHLVTGSASDQITVSSLYAAHQSSQQNLQELQQQHQQEQLQVQQRTVKSQSRRSGVGRALADGLGSLKSRLKASLPRSRSARSSVDRGEPGAGERKNIVDASVTGMAAGWASTYTETDSTYSDQDTSSTESDRQSNRRCRWRKSRVIHVSQGSSSNHNACKESAKPLKIIHAASLPSEKGPGAGKSAPTGVPSGTFLLPKQSALPPAESHLRQSKQFFAAKSSRPVDQEAARHSVSVTPLTSADLAAAAAPTDPGMEADRQFLSGRRGRLSAASLGGRHPASQLIQSGMLKNVESDAKFQKQLRNNNGSNRAAGSRLVSRLPSLERLREAEMVAGHHTEPHFTSDGGPCESRRCLAVTGAGEAENCSSHSRKRNLVRRRCRHVVLIQPQVVHWDLQLSQIVANPKARRHRSRQDLLLGSASSSSASYEPAHSDQSLPTVTSAALKLDFNRQKAELRVKRPAEDSPGHIVHWCRLRQVPPSERCVSAKVKRVGERRWRDRRIAKAAFLERAHCPEVVDNPSLATSDNVGADLPERGHVSSATIATVSTCNLATSSCSIGSSCSDSSSSLNITKELTTANSRFRPRCRSSSVGSSKPTSRSVSCYAQLKRQRRRSLGDDRAPEAGDYRVNDRIAGEFDKQPRLRFKATPLELENTATTEELACLPAQLGSLNCSSAAVAQWAELTDCRWLLAKRSQLPKTGYSHSVHYLPSVTVINAKAPKLSYASGAAAAAAGAALPAARSTLFIACELTVGRPRRRLKTAATTSDAQDGLRISNLSSA